MTDTCKVLIVGSDSKHLSQVKSFAIIIFAGLYNYVMFLC